MPVQRNEFGSNGSALRVNELSLASGMALAGSQAYDARINFCRRGGMDRFMEFW